MASQIGAVDHDQLVITRGDPERIGVIGVIASGEFGLDGRREKPEVPPDHGESVAMVVLVRECIFDNIAPDLRDGANLPFVSNYLNKLEIRLWRRQAKIGERQEATIPSNRGSRLYYRRSIDLRRGAKKGESGRVATALPDVWKSAENLDSAITLAGLDPGIHVFFLFVTGKDVDPREGKFW